MLFAPFLPHTSEQLHAALGYTKPLFGQQKVETLTDDLGEHTALRYDPAGAIGKWEAERLEPGRPFAKPRPLFKRLDESIVEEERARLG